MISEKTIKEEWTNKNYSDDNYQLHLLTASLWILTIEKWNGGASS